MLVRFMSFALGRLRYALSLHLTVWRNICGSLAEATARGTGAVTMVAASRTSATAATMDVSNGSATCAVIPEEVPQPAPIVSECATPEDKILARDWCRMRGGFQTSSRRSRHVDCVNVDSQSHGHAVPCNDNNFDAIMEAARADLIEAKRSGNPQELELARQKFRAAHALLRSSSMYGRRRLVPPEAEVCPSNIPSNIVKSSPVRDSIVHNTGDALRTSNNLGAAHVDARIPAWM